MELNEYCNIADVSEVGFVAKLDTALRSQPNFKKLSMDEIISCCSGRKDIASLLVGLWSFDFLKDPQFIDGRLQGYYGEYFSAEQVGIIARGILSVIQFCKIESDEDVHAIEYHYSACGKLYRLLGDKAEDLLLEQLEQKPSMALIDAMGVLAGHQMKGSLMDISVKQLEKISKENTFGFGEYAKKILVEDVWLVSTDKK